MTLSINGGSRRRTQSPRGLERLGGAESRKGQAAEAIRRHILDGTLEPGGLYSVSVIAEALGVSRTPVREALIDLAAQGLVRFERNRGVRISKPDSTDLAEIMELRLLLEVPALRRAAPRLDERALRALAKAVDGMAAAAHRNNEDAYHRHDRAFHETILESCGNQRLAEIVESLLDQTLRQGLSIAGRERSLELLVDDHRTLLDALQRGDGDAAAEAQTRILKETAESRGLTTDDGWVVPAANAG
jgi:DNA-binding GntR family transcriptional regulator